MARTDGVSKASWIAWSTRPFSMEARWPLLAALTCGCAIAAGASAKTYYLSSSAGDDANDGLAPVAVRSAGPWRTLDRLASVQVGDGDHVLFRCGDRFAGQLDVNAAKGGNEPLRLGSYGDCGATDRPVIDGSRPIDQAATDASGRLTVPNTRDITQVFVDGVTIPQARYPASDYVMIPKNTMPAKDGLLQSLISDRDVIGAGIFARTQAWYIESRTIARVAAGVMRFDKPLEWPLDPGSGFYLTNKAWMVGTDPSWAFDAQLQTLVVRTRDGASRPEGVRVSYREPLVRVAGPGSIRIEGIVIERAGQDALEIRVKGDVKVINVVVRDAARSGIVISGASSAVVSSSVVERVGQDGMVLERSSNVVARANTLRDISVSGNPRPALAAINATSSAGATIENNTISGAGYIGIRFSHGSVVQGNTIERTCVTMADCGAIYTWRGNARDEKVSPSIVSDNTVVGVLGEPTIKPGWRTYAAGIYLDDFTSNVTVSNNVVAEARQGIYLHNAFQNTLEGNTIFASGDVSLAIVIDSDKFTQAQRLENSVENNGFFSPLGEESIRLIRRSPNDPLARFAGNTISSVTSKQQRISVYRNDGTFESPRYSRSDQSAKSLTGDDNEVLLESTGARGGAAPKWRIERSGGGRRLTNGVRTVIQTASEQSTAKRSIENANCRRFQPKPYNRTPADGGRSTGTITVCDEPAK